MPTYTYSAVKRDGTTVKGEQEAESQKILSQTLKSSGLFLLEAKEGGTLSQKTGLNLSFNFSAVLARLKPIALVDKIFFTRNLAVMIEAGLPLTRALNALAQESNNSKFKKIIEEIMDMVIKGRPFNEALKTHPKVFGDFFISMVEVGETTGKLTMVLKLVANQMKKDYNLRRRVRGALIYPAIIVTALIGIGAMMMIYVIPTLSDTITGLGVELPTSTKVIIAISNFMVAYTLWLGIGLILLIAAFWRFIHTEYGKQIFDRINLRLPIFGPLILKFNEARFSRTLAYLTGAGVPIVQSLEITSRVIGNTLFKNATKKASEEIKKGSPLHEILEAYPNIFRPLMIQMISVGEETGKISDMLLRMAIFFEEEVNDTTKNLSTVIEPLLMIVIGVIVGFFAVSVLQPIYSSLGNIK